jgi:hypothetical protein
MIRIAPISAVPSDAPRFWAVPCRPPASLVCAGGADEMITLPSCDARRPAPIPKMPSPTANPMALSSTSRVASRTTAASATARRPRRQTARGDRRAAILGPDRAAINIVTDIGSSRSPVSRALRPSTTWR